MLFDTSSPARRRGVQVIFAFLAILMGGGLVLFGIGSSNTQGGGLLDNIGNGGSNTVVSDAKKDADKAQTALDANPKDVAAALTLAKANVTIARAEAFDANGQAAGKDSANQIAAAEAAWTAYLKLAPAKPDATTAKLYSSFYQLPAVGKYDQAARALEAALVTQQPTAGLYATLAFDWLVAGDKTKYQEARTKALSLADDTRKKSIASQLDDYAKQVADYEKAQAKQAAAQSSSSDSSSSGSTGTTPKLPTLPTLQ